MKVNMPIHAWGHAILHTAALIRIRPIAYHEYYHLQLVFGKEPDISHLNFCCCRGYIPITPPQCSKMGSQRKLWIYVEFELPFIIKYLDPLTEWYLDSEIWWLSI